MRDKRPAPPPLRHPPWLAALIGAACAVPVDGHAAEGGPAHLELRNRETLLVIPLPDPAAGYYRGQRFVWGGMVTQLTWRNRTLFTQLRQPQDPVGPEGAAGACEEFGMDGPLGYDAAAPGARFAKIGVGALTRISAAPYQFNVRYPIAEAGAWKVQSTTSSATFDQEFHLDGSWAWRYVVRIQADPDGYRIERTLSNLGSRTIDTDHYDHHMFAIDGRAIDGSWKMSYPTALAAEHPTDQFTVAAGTVSLTGPVQGSLWSPFTCDLSRPAQAVTLEHGESRTRIAITSSRALSKLVLYAERTAICPEPFTAIRVPPGQDLVWSTQYVVSDIPAP